MTPSRANFQLLAVAACLCLASQFAAAASPPEGELAAAATAIAAAEQWHPQGQAAQDLQRSRDLLAQAQDFSAKRKYKEAALAAQGAQAQAALAQARAHLAQAQLDVDEKTARNADLRRQLLVLPGGGQ